uniref:DNA (cytosine-5-)-methyltransferase n=1 Tax=Candidatus Kentrum sp. FM TaxID=2126340 RepID=A0A450S6A2_9GAMM|nr:MAG: DNA (cytosine-5)-methyltransferase 1 [Candidatus Kentron sp. FM]VFJ47869.1 MAG: DNA (cytosine-5)-methyltransferase 1 [Candidatus Kentron sp. FM]VFK07844.1 MAG: DNA (cytosine-5)-methyltransferase 1 [Candidatus Kentron sp. FM]
MTIVHHDILSGIGGFSLAARWVWGNEQTPAFFCERDPFCRWVLHRNFPGVPIHRDLRLLGGVHDSVDLVSAGFPCQPYSRAGKRRGAEDERDLWTEIVRFLAEGSARWFIGENTYDFAHLGLDNAISDLEGLGYTTGTFVLPACSVGAPHRRDRLWIVAHADRDGESMRPIHDFAKWLEQSWFRQQAGSFCREKWPIGSPFSRGNDGLPDGVSWTRQEVIRAIGNSVVPQLVAGILSGIRAVDDYYLSVNSQK